MSFKLKIVYYLIQLKVHRLLYGKRNVRLQKKGLKRLKKHLQKSPFYCQYLNSQTQLEDFPVVNKKVFMDNFDTINTCKIKLSEAYEVAVQAEKSRDFSPMIHNITVGLSSGTSGNRGVFLASIDERAQWVAYVLDRVIGFSLKKRSIAFFLRANSNIYDSVKSKVLAFHFFDLFDSMTIHIERLTQLQPTILVAQPSMLVAFAQAIEKGELSLAPQKVISVAEVLTPEDKTYLSNIFQQPIHQVYQCTEGFLASTCTEGTLHFHEDFLLIEKKYLDDKKERFHPIITDLNRRSQPVIRYELNDIITAKSNCSCGSAHLAIEAIEGRSDDILRFHSNEGKEVSIFPDFFRRAIIMADDTISDYMVIQKSLTSLELYIQSTSSHAYQIAETAIQQLLTQYHVNAVIIQPLATRQHEIGTKLRRIKNES